ncbi:MAG TPA: GDSL-type esterase/lipase family protein [Candidatus Bathyarchaeia archaeon]|nr:GDSL-type esterase/lipase family protein [Candidatus Bathyarchaeia archaeon]
MSKTSLKQGIGLVFLGLFLAAALLEITLRIGGLIFIARQKSLNRADFSQKEFRILCIGESTTALGGENSYPAQLEKLLRQQAPEVFSRVINAGMVAKTSQDILDALPDYLDRYKPHLVIAMIGINDRKDVFDNASSWHLWIDRFRENFRIYHLFENVRERIRVTWSNSKKDSAVQPRLANDRLNPKNQHRQIMIMYVKGEDIFRQLEERLKRPFTPEKEKTAKDLLERLKKRQSWLLVELARQVREKGQTEKEMEFLQKALGYDPDNYGAHVELARFYKGQQKCPEAVPFLEKAVKLKPETALASMELAHCYDVMGMTEKAAETYRFVLERAKSDTSLVDGDIAEWFFDHDLGEDAEKSFDEAVRENPDNQSLYQSAAEYYQRTGNLRKAQTYAGKAETLRNESEFYAPMTVHNYNEILKILAARHIPVMCMQYPLRDIEPLKKIFWKDYPIIFVENKKNFQAALEKTDYYKLFSDSFAGDFGHCTKKGNALIAQHLAEVILSLPSLPVMGR